MECHDNIGGTQVESLILYTGVTSPTFSLVRFVEFLHSSVFFDVDCIWLV